MVKNSSTDDSTVPNSDGESKKKQKKTSKGSGKSSDRSTGDRSAPLSDVTQKSFVRQCKNEGKATGIVRNNSSDEDTVVGNSQKKVCVNKKNSESIYRKSCPRCESNVTDDNGILEVTGRESEFTQRREKSSKKQSVRKILTPLLLGAEMSKRETKRVSKEEAKKERRKTSRTSKQKRERKEDDRRWRRELRKTVEKHKKRKVIIHCSCKVTKWMLFKERMYPMKRFLSRIPRSCSILCCPPLLPYQVEKAAFWPPECAYFFFRDKRKSEEVSPLEADTIVRQLNDTCVPLPWRLGFDHPCSDEFHGVEGFVVKTAHENFLGGLLVRVKHPKTPNYTMIYSHSNAEDLSDLVRGIPNILDMSRFYGCDLISYDYSGYGISSGRPDEDNLYADIEAIYLYATEKLHVPSERIILFGYSIGTAATVHLAAKCGSKWPLAGVVLIAPMCTVLGAMCGCCSVNCQKRCRSDLFNNYEKISNISVPLLIVHGEKDLMVPVEHGKKLHKKYEEKSPHRIPPLWIPTAEHSGIDNHWEMWERIEHFMYRELPENRIIQDAAKITVTPTSVQNVDTNEKKLKKD